MPVQKLSEAYVRALPHPAAGQVIYCDTATQGLGVRVTPTKKTYVVEHRLRGTGKNRRYTIGPCEALSLSVARVEARKIIGELATGHDRREAERRQQQLTMSVRTIFTDYLAVKPLKAKTAAGYRRVFMAAYPEWLDKPWVSITGKMILAKHQALTAEHGKAYANLASRVLAAIMQHALDTHRRDDAPLLPENPASVLNRTHAWHRLNPRKDHIDRDDFKAWWAAVRAEPNTTIRDYLILVVMTGLRMSEALGIRWEHIDFVARTVLIPETKNGRPHVLPLTPYVNALLQTRKNTSPSPWVFPGSGRSGHLMEPKKAISRIVRVSGVKFSSHPLRRTLAVYGDWLGVDKAQVSRILNHTLPDVTSVHYQPIEVERLREPLGRINDWMLKLASEIPTAEVIPLVRTA